jgi:hypothetical protein
VDSAIARVLANAEHPQRSLLLPARKKEQALLSLRAVGFLKNRQILARAAKPWFPFLKAPTGPKLNVSRRDEATDFYFGASPNTSAPNSAITY